jgi:hypothetical protein
MISQKVLDKVRNRLLFSGGLHIQVPSGKNKKLSFNEILPYHREMLYEARHLRYPEYFNDVIQSCAKIVLLAIELNLIYSQFDDEIDFIPQEELTSLYTPEVVVDQINNILFSKSGVKKYSQSLIWNTLSFMNNSLDAHLSGCTDELINEILEAVADHNLSIFHLNIASAQWYVAHDYLKQIGVEPTAENAEKLLQYKDVFIDGELKCRYWGESIQKPGYHTTIMMRPKTIDLILEQKIKKTIYYQIRGARDGERKLFTVVRLDGNLYIKIINGPHIKKVGINFME